MEMFTLLPWSSLEHCEYVCATPVGFLWKIIVVGTATKVIATGFGVLY